jgi:D-alanyl-D-alanine dipeptidase
MPRWLECLAVVGALFLFVLASVSWIYHLGVEYDEAHFYPTAIKIAYGAEEMLPLPHGVTVAHRPIPFLTMPYVGVLDALVYALPYRVFGSSPLVPRYTNVALGALTMLGAWWLARSLGGTWAGLFALAVLLCDLEWLLHVPTNYGPLVLQQLFTVWGCAALLAWWRSRKQIYFYLAIAALALAFHEKLTFIWVLSSLAVAALLTHWREIRAASRPRQYALGFVLAFAILSPILYYTYSLPEIVLGFGRQNAGVRVGFGELLSQRWHSLNSMLRGVFMLEFTAGPVPEYLRRGPGLLALFLASFLVPHKGAQLLSLTALGIWVWNLFFTEAGRMHHVLLLVPLWQCAIGIGFGIAHKGIRLALAALMLWSGADTFHSLIWYSARTQATGGANHWSDVTAQAAEWLAANAELAPATPNWGISRPVFSLSGGNVDVEEHYFETLGTFTPQTRERIGALIRKRRVVWLISDVLPVYAEQWQRIVALAKELGRGPRPVAVFPSRDDRFHLRAYRFDLPEPPLNLWRDVELSSGTAVLLPRNLDIVQLETEALADREGQHITLEWLDAAGRVLFTDSRPLFWLPFIRPSHRFDFAPDLWPPTFSRHGQSSEAPAQLRLSWELGGAPLRARFALRSFDEPRSYPENLDPRIGEYGDTDHPSFLTERAGQLVFVLPNGIETTVPSSLAPRLAEPNRNFRIQLRKPIEELRRAADAATPPPQPKHLLSPDLVNLARLSPTIRLDIRYATTNNFMGTPLYSRPIAFLQRPAAEALLRVHESLREEGFGLWIHDAYRPWRVTKMFWDATPEAQRNFVANPANGSRHNRGCAVDLTLYDLRTGEPVRMPSGFDEFSRRAFPDYPGGTSRQRWLRGLLRRHMEREGFTVNEDEWWHFDFRDWRRYPVLNISFEELDAR